MIAIEQLVLRNQALPSLKNKATAHNAHRVASTRKTWFFLDFITVFPFDVITLAADGGDLGEFKRRSDATRYTEAFGRRVIWVMTG